MDMAADKILHYLPPVVFETRVYRLYSSSYQVTCNKSSILRKIILYNFFFFSLVSCNDVMGQPLKLEVEEGDISSDAPCPSTPVPLNNKFRSEMKPFFVSGKDIKPSDKLRFQGGYNSGGVSVKKNSSASVMVIFSYKLYFSLFFFFLNFSLTS